MINAGGSDFIKTLQEKGLLEGFVSHLYNK